MPSRLNFLSTLTGSFATPCAENPSVAMVEAAYRHHGIDARYINCDVQPADLGDAVRGARAMGWAGFNCSLPHKVAVIAHLDALAPSAQLIGAVNCVVVREGRLIGENTDGQGFVESLRGLVHPAGRRVVVLGAGGAARAIAVEVALAGAACVVVVSRDARPGAELADLLEHSTPARATRVAWDAPFGVPADADILVNATSVGLYPAADELPAIDFGSLRSGLIVADVVANPPRTALLRQAAARGCRTLDGLGMLVNQGRIGIEHWTGVKADAAVMRATLEALFRA